MPAAVVHAPPEEELESAVLWPVVQSLAEEMMQHNDIAAVARNGGRWSCLPRMYRLAEQLKVGAGALYCAGAVIAKAEHDLVNKKMVDVAMGWVRRVVEAGKRGRPHVRVKWQATAAIVDVVVFAGVDLGPV